jgi:hypothetical protein
MKVLQFILSVLLWTVTLIILLLIWAELKAHWNAVTQLFYDTYTRLGLYDIPYQAVDSFGKIWWLVMVYAVFTTLVQLQIRILEINESK